MDLAALKTEITTDPASIGYAGKDDVQVADLLNAPTRQPNRESISGGELAAAVDFTEFAALATAIHRQYLQLLTAADAIPLNAAMRTTLAGFFPQGSTTRANLISLLKRAGSRAEELGLGFVTPSHVADARRL